MTIATSDVNASRIDELPTALDGIAKLVRSGLGIRAFGVQVFDIPPGVSGPAHDETATGQEELYVALRGSGALLVDGERVMLDPEHVVRVGPATTRALSSGPDGLRVLCVGGTPGEAYQPPYWSEV